MAWTVSTVRSAVCVAATSNRARIASITDRATGPADGQFAVLFTKAHVCHRVSSRCPIVATMNRNRGSRAAPSPGSTRGASRPRARAGQRWSAQDLSHRLARRLNARRSASHRDQCAGAWSDPERTVRAFPSSEFELGLGQEDRRRKIGAGEVCPAEVGSHEVGPSQVGTAQVGPGQHRTEEVGTAQIRAPEVRSP